MERKVDIYFTSDLHGYMYPTDYRGPEEKDLGLFKCAKRLHRDGNTLIIDGGDVLQGSAFAAFCHDSLGTPQPLADILNDCSYDYVTLGNHDFNFGSDYLGDYLRGLRARCVCENLLGDDGECRYPSCIRVLENGLRIGLVGIITDHVNLWEKPEHLTGVAITDPLPAARQALDALRGQVDLTVCIYHGGFERDLESGRVLSRSTENIAWHLCRYLDFDILLTGHQHMSVPGQKLFGTYVVQPAENGKEFHHLEAWVDGTEKRITSQLIHAAGACDGALLSRFSEVERGAQNWLREVVGHLDHALLPAAPLIRAAEGSEIADFFNQVQLFYSGAQLSSVSLANEIAGFPQTVHRRDILTTYPYPNTLVVLKVTGAILRQAIERSAEYFDLDADGRLTISDRFLKPKVEHYNYDYFAGISYRIDVSKPVGNRVVRLEYGGAPVQAGDAFTLCMNNYRSSGAGGYFVYQTCPVVNEINVEMSDLLMDYFEKFPEISCPSVPSYRVIW